MRFADSVFFLRNSSRSFKGLLQCSSEIVLTIGTSLIREDMPIFSLLLFTASKYNGSVFSPSIIKIYFDSRTLFCEAERSPNFFISLISHPRLDIR